MGWRVINFLKMFVIFYRHTVLYMAVPTQCPLLHFPKFLSHKWHTPCHFPAKNYPQAPHINPRVIIGLAMEDSGVT